MTNEQTDGQTDILTNGQNDRQPKSNIAPPPFQKRRNQTGVPLLAGQQPLTISSKDKSFKSELS